MTDNKCSMMDSIEIPYNGISADEVILSLTKVRDWWKSAFANSGLEISYSISCLHTWKHNIHLMIVITTNVKGEDDIKKYFEYKERFIEYFTPGRILKQAV